jgi:mannose-6-phosphate isomerase-like protein (cupin superfamily)
MARAGDVLENAATGDRLTFLHTAADTGGAFLEYELRFVPRGFAARDHLHPHQEERHEVLGGSLGLVVDGREFRLEAGESETVPVGARHRIVKSQDEPILARFSIRPALESEVLLETLFAIGRDPGFLQLAVIFDEFPALGRAPRPSPAVQRTMLKPLAALGRARGYRARYG